MYCLEFENFLKKIDLNKYRNLYKPIKIVEMDLPVNIQAIFLLYKIYWEEKKFIEFETFYSEYLETYYKNIEVFRKKIGMCKRCFYKGLPARIYRTWASIITQIHAGYIAEKVFGKESVEMSEELDRKGADFIVNYMNEIINFQVKKISYSREVRQEKKIKNKLKGKFIKITYEVPTEDVFNKPKKRNGQYKISYIRFINDKRLKRLNNGFVVFTKYTFYSIKEKIDNKIKL